VRKLSIAIFTILLAGCAGLGLGDLGGLGDILGSSGGDDASDVRGTVLLVDSGNRRIDLDVSYINNLRDDRRGSSIYYDSQTVVEFQGRTYRPEDLERGDEISVRGSNRDGRFVADRITVVRDVSR
jgi:hypothetical protein